MKKFRRFMRSRGGTYLMFAAAAVLLLVSSVGGARAALIYSQTYSSRVEMFDIGVALVENGEDVSWRDYDQDNRNGTWNEETGKLLAHMLDGADGEKEKLKLGVAYPEKLQVRNNGNINEYVRVTIYKYWTRDGKKENAYDLSPDMIDLNLLTEENSNNGWHIDKASSKGERTVLYYDRLLYAEGEGGESLSEPFSDTVTINGEVADLVKEATETSSDGKAVTTRTYAYDGASFVLEARVDAVQEHNACDAIWSAWGRRATLNGDRLRISEKIDE